MFICTLKIHSIILFFLKILHFKESCNLIGQHHFGPYFENQNFTRYEIGGEILLKILFPEKTSDKIFQKNPKKPILGPFWAPFTQIWVKIYFPGKKSYVSFKIFQVSTSVQ